MPRLKGQTLTIRLNAVQYAFAREGARIHGIANLEEYVVQAVLAAGMFDLAQEKANQSGTYDALDDMVRRKRTRKSKPTASVM